MNIAEMQERLAAPFPIDKVEWRVGSKTKDGLKGMALGYVDARTVRDRLTEVCGLDWQSRHFVSHDGSMIGCEIGVKNPETGEWIWRSDGGGKTDFESEKGGYSDSMKRAAVSFNVGRYLYDLPSPWVALDQYGNIPDHEKERLYGYLPNAGEGLKVSPLTGQAKEPGKFWSNKVLNILTKMPQKLKDAHGDADWGNPDAVVWAVENLPHFIDKAPSRLALTALQVDNAYWLKNNIPQPDQDHLMSLFVIRASQFDGVKK